MADENRMITFEYARATYDVFKKKTIPLTKQCMTKSKVIEYINCEEVLMDNYTNDRLVPRVKVVGKIPMNLPGNLTYTFDYQGVLNGNNYAQSTNYNEKYSPIRLDNATRSYTGGSNIIIAANNNLQNIIDDILTLTTAPRTSITMKRSPLLVSGVSGDSINIIGKRVFGNNVEFIPSTPWQQAINGVGVNDLEGEVLVNINNYEDSENYFQSGNLYPGGPTQVVLKYFNIEIFNGSEGTTYYRNFRVTPKSMPLFLEFFSSGISIGNVVINHKIN